MPIIKRRALGLDIGDSSIKWVLYDYVKRYTLYNHGVLELPPGWVKDGKIVNLLGVATRLGSVLKGLCNKVTKASVTLGCTEMFIRTAYMPKLMPGEMKRAVEYEMEYLFPGDTEEYILDYKILDEEMLEGIRQTRILICGLPLVVVKGYLELLNILNLEPQAFDFHGNSASRVLNISGGKKKNESQMIIDIGAHTTAITFLERGIPVLARVLQKGGAEITGSIADAFGIASEDAEERKKNHRLVYLEGQRPGNDTSLKMEQCIMPFVEGLLDEIYSSIQFYNSRSRYSVSSALVVGGGSYLKGLRHFILTNAGLREIPENDILSYLMDMEFSAERLSKFINVLGLVLRVDRAKAKDLNLLPTKYKDIKKTKRERLVKLLAGVAAIVIVAGAIFLPLHYRDNLDLRNKGLWREIENRDKIIELWYTREVLLKRLAEREEMMSKLCSPSIKWSSFFIELQKRTPLDIRLRSVNCSEEGTVTIHGLATDYSAASRFIHDIQQLDGIKVIRPISIKRIKDEVLDIKLECVPPGLQK